ncbi:DUF386 domain-containing protein [Vibrio sp. SM6]|uniref:DUF386 domain-containing protein n=1 Tax=Vibrio agarilyticus TaxID=2726741 RepID=A0A7X8TSX3_9VIBR|nr:YhcH/YjgK/YiaL family protein [Vibrio agarilyticus]NLS14226.1 DUF386 domain-containing protein [Vibrio agarilyticus]
MFFGNIDKLDSLPLLELRYRKLIEEAWKIAQNETLGKFSLSEKDAFVIIAMSECEPREQRKAEVHQRYIDVQILKSGCEEIGFTNVLPPQIDIKNPFENDIVFFDRVNNEKFIKLDSKDFVIFYPGQIHRPLCAIKGQSTKVEKIIVKIPMY